MEPVAQVTSDLPEDDGPLSLSWRENPAAKKLLDALVSILSKEYIQVAKANPEIFSE